MEGAQTPLPPPAAGPPAPQAGYPGYAAQPPGQYPPHPYDPRYGAPPPWGVFPPYVPGPTKKTSDGIIIAVVVAIIVLLIVVPVIYVLMAGLTTGPSPMGPTQPTIVLHGDQWSGGNLTLTVLSTSGGTIPSNSISFQLTAPNGTVYYNGVQGFSTTVGATTTNVTLNDPVDPGTLSAGDSVNIAVRPNPIALHGSTLRVLMNTDVLATVRIP